MSNGTIVYAKVAVATARPRHRWKLGPKRTAPDTVLLRGAHQEPTQDGPSVSIQRPPP